MTNIRIKRGEEIRVNGFSIRAVGFNAHNPEQLSIAKTQPKREIWGGLCDEVVVASQIIVGTKWDELPNRVNKRFV